MKRQVRCRLEFVVEVDDAGSGVPAIHADLGETIAAAACALFPQARLVPGGKGTVNLTRESAFEARRLAKLVRPSKMADQ